MRKLIFTSLFSIVLLLSLGACSPATEEIPFPTVTLIDILEPSPEPALPTETALPVVIEPTATQAAPTLEPTSTQQVIVNTPVAPQDGVNPTATSVLPTATVPAVTATSIPPTPTSGPTATARPVLNGEALTVLYAFGDQDAWGQTGYPGDGGKYWRLINTKDGGKTWKVVSPPGGYPTESRYFAIDKGAAWVASAIIPASGPVDNGYVYATKDRGATWTKSNAIPLKTGDAVAQYFMPQALYFIDYNTGWLVASIGRFSNQDVLIIFMTTDGGKNWTRQTDKFAASVSGAGLPCSVDGIGFVSATRGWLAGNCLAVSLDERWSVLQTDDGGKTWAKVNLPEPANAPAAVLGGNTAEKNVACGTSGLQIQLPATVILNASCMVTAGGYTDYYQFTYVSTDSGATWSGAQVSGASFYSATEGYAIGPWVKSTTRYIMQTKDGGKTWKDVYRLAWPEAKLDFSSGLLGWSVVRSYSPARSAWGYMLVKTTDGGGTWGQVSVMLP